MERIDQNRPRGGALNETSERPTRLRDRLMRFLAERQTSQPDRITETSLELGQRPQVDWKRKHPRWWAPSHGSRFDGRDGATSGPPRRALRRESHMKMFNGQRGYVM